VLLRIGCLSSCSQEDPQCSRGLLPRAKRSVFGRPVDSGVQVFPSNAGRVLIPKKETSERRHAEEATLSSYLDD
jgi:hypothetical protein